MGAYALFLYNVSNTNVTIDSVIVSKYNGNTGITANMDANDYEGDTP